MKRLIITSCLIIVVLCGMFTVNQAKARDVSGRTIEHRSLIANKSFQTWTSQDNPGSVYVHVYLNTGQEIPQRWVNKCRANYHAPSRGLYIWIWIQNCRAPRTEPRSYALEYLSAYGYQRFSVWLTTSARG